MYPYVAVFTGFIDCLRRNPSSRKPGTIPRQPGCLGKEDGKYMPNLCEILITSRCMLIWHQSTCCFNSIHLAASQSGRSVSTVDHSATKEGQCQAARCLLDSSV